MVYNQVFIIQDEAPVVQRRRDPMPYNFFALIARMRYIDRWGLMRNTHTENIQEHSHMVAVLAHALAVIGKEKFGSRVDPSEVPGGAEGGERRIQPGRRPDPGRPGGHRPARPSVFYGGISARLYTDAG